MKKDLGRKKNVSGQNRGVPINQVTRNNERITQHEPSSASPREPSSDLRTELRYQTAYEWMLSAASRRKCLVYPMQAITISSELASRCLSGRKGAFD